MVVTGGKWNYEKWRSLSWPRGQVLGIEKSDISVKVPIQECSLRSNQPSYPRKECFSSICSVWISISRPAEGGTLPSYHVVTSDALPRNLLVFSAQPEDGAVHFSRTFVSTNIHPNGYRCQNPEGQNLSCHCREDVNTDIPQLYLVFSFARDLSSIGLYFTACFGVPYFFMPCMQTCCNQLPSQPSRG
jgi:hypothetical protein